MPKILVAPYFPFFLTPNSSKIKTMLFNRNYLIFHRPVNFCMKSIDSFIVILSLSLFSGSLLAAQSCKMPDKSDLIWANAEFAISGDTLVIQNQKTRLIGIDAPQKERKQKFNTPGQPLADEAQEFLNKLIANQDLKVGILYDKTRVDKFGRQLVHAFFEDGTSVQAEMLKAGFAIYRPEFDNHQFASCYMDAEKQAREGGYQLWDLLAKQPELHYPLIQSSEIFAEDEGYRIIKGEIVLSKPSKKFLVLKGYYLMNMDTLGIRIPVKEQAKFDQQKLRELVGKTIEARGLVYHYKGAMYMVIDTPYAIDVLAQDALKSLQD